MAVGTVTAIILQLYTFISGDASLEATWRRWFVEVHIEEDAEPIQFIVQPHTLASTGTDICPDQGFVLIFCGYLGKGRSDEAPRWSIWHGQTQIGEQVELSPVMAWGAPASDTCGALRVEADPPHSQTNTAVLVLGPTHHPDSLASYCPGNTFGGALARDSEAYRRRLDAEFQQRHGGGEAP